MMGAAGGKRDGQAVPRRWCVPPAIQRDPGEKLEGDHVLEESPCALGLLLWRTVRDVSLWAETPPGRRADLFRDGSAFALLVGTDVPPEVSAAVDTLHGMLTLGSRADTELVSQCCLQVAAWARRAGLARTAVAFAQAGALVSPQYAEAAVHVGVYARAAGGQEARAATWLRRAVGLARRERDRIAYSVALVELGLFYEGTGDAARAERFYRLGFRTGRRYAARAARMRAAHGLFRLARKRGDNAGAAQFALSAQGVYDPDGAGAPDLLLDVARFWTEAGEPVRARAAIRRLLRSGALLSSEHQLAATAVGARVLAVTGSRGRSELLAAGAWERIGNESIPQDVRFRAALDLAHAARLLGDFAAFTHAKRAVLLLAPQAAFPAAAAEVAGLWPAESAAKPARAAS